MRNFLPTVMVAVLFVVIALSVAFPCFAQEPVPTPTVSAFSLERLSLAVGANYDWWSGDNVPPAPQEFAVGIYAAYALTAPNTGKKVPALSLVGGVERGFDNRTILARLGVRVTLFNGGK